METIQGRRGFRRESIATQTAQHVLDEVFRSSIRGPRNAYYGAVRGNNTMKPRMTDWIQEIPTPRIVAKSTMPQSIPSISISEEFKSSKRRHISLASTVIESEGETDELTTTSTAREGNRLVGEEHDGDDEYDEANAVMEEEDVTDQDTRTELLRVYPVQSRSPRKARPSPTRRWSSKPGKFGQRGRKARSRSPSSDKEKESQGRRWAQRSEDGFPLEKNVLVEKLRSLERLVEDIRHVLNVQSPASTSTTL